MVKIDDLFPFDDLYVVSGRFAKELPRWRVADETQLDAKRLAPSQHCGKDMPADKPNDKAVFALIIVVDDQSLMLWSPSC